MGIQNIGINLGRAALAVAKAPVTIPVAIAKKAWQNPDKAFVAFAALSFLTAIAYQNREAIEEAARPTLDALKPKLAEAQDYLRDLMAHYGYAEHRTETTQVCTDQSNYAKYIQGTWLDFSLIKDNFQNLVCEDVVTKVNRFGV